MARPEVALAALLALTVVRLAVAAGTNLAPDEAYYWVWSRVLQPGYLDGPPMAALWIRGGTWLAGVTPFGVRLLAPIAALVGSLLFWRAARDFFPDRPGVGLSAVALFNATLLVGAGSVIMTPDTPLLFFWVLGLFAIGRLIATGHGKWWLLAGLAAGMMLDAKYTGFLFLAAVGFWMLASRIGRRWLRRPEPWFGLVIALTLFVPVVAWNASHHWVSFLKQGGRLGAWRPATALGFEAGLVGGQIGLFTPLVFLLAVAGTWRLATNAGRSGDPASALLTWLTLVPAALFVEHALGDRVQGNWPAVLYPSALLAAAALEGRRWTRLRIPAVILGLAITGLVYLQAATAAFPISARFDPSLRELGGWPRLAREVAMHGRADGAGFVALGNYGEAAELAFLDHGPWPVVGIGPRWKFFRLPPAGPAIGGEEGLLLERRGRGAPDSRQWRVLAPPVPLTRRRGRMVAQSYLLYRVRARQVLGGAVLPAR